jgi:hypothetical protein
MRPFRALDAFLKLCLTLLERNGGDDGTRTSGLCRDSYIIDNANVYRDVYRIASVNRTGRVVSGLPLIHEQSASRPDLESRHLAGKLPNILTITYL